MRCVWDERKRLSNLRIHGLDFRDAPGVFDGSTFTIDDARFADGEQRFLTLGLLGEVGVSIVHTEAPDLIRIISFRKATRHEEVVLFQSLKD
ncbi:MAG: BrnT family toxin [Pseudomonadota bacterium]